MDVAEQAGGRERESARRDELLALGAALVTVALWASAFVAIRDAGEELSAGALALARLGAASVVLAAFVFVRRERRPDAAICLASSSAGFSGSGSTTSP